MRSETRLALVGVVAALALAAGCVGDQAPGDGDDGNASAATPHVEDFVVPEHDHEDTEREAPAHAYSSPTIEQVAHHQLTEGTAPSYIGELDSQANLTAVAIVGQGSTPGFVLLDTSDPTEPEKLARVEAPESYAVDVKLTEDGRFAFLATQQITDNRVPEGGPPSPADAGEWAASNGFLVYDLQDPAQPELVHVENVDSTGCHMLNVAEIDGTEHVFCVAQSITTFRFERQPAPTTVEVGTYWPDGEQGYQTSVDKGEAVPGPLPHDMTFREDPVDGTPLLTVSHWDLGAIVLDVSTPSAPQELTRWTGEGAEHYDGYVHSAIPTVVNDTRVLIVTPETLSDVLSPIWVLDIDDWNDEPEVLAEWVNPGGHTTQGLTMTVHQIQVVDDRLYLAYNHNGFWVFDLPTMVENGGNGPENGEIVGAHMPETGGIPLYDRDSFPSGIPSVWDVNVVDGYVLGTDRYTGLHVLHAEGDPAGAEDHDSFA